MLPLLAALTSGLAFTVLQITFKRHVSNTLTPLALPAFLTFLCPIWATLFILSHSHHLLFFNLSPNALIFPIFWATCTVTTTTLLVWLLSQFSLTEVAGYKKALITLGAISSDLLVFATNFPLLKLVAIGLILAAALTLGHTRQRLPTLKEWAILLIWCTLLTIQITLYKQGLSKQPEVLSHTILAQFFATALYGLFWLSPAVAHQYFPKITVIYTILTCAFIGVLLEGFAYAGLPLAVVMVVTILPATLFAAHDLYSGTLIKSPKTFSALAMLALGFIFLLIPA